MLQFHIFSSSFKKILKRWANTPTTHDNWVSGTVAVEEAEGNFNSGI